MLLGLGTLALARTYYLDHLPAEVSSRAAATAVYDTFFRFYGEALRTLLTIVVIVAVAILVIWRTPGVAGPLWLTAAVLLVLAAVELAAHSADHPADRADPDQPS